MPSSLKILCFLLLALNACSYKAPSPGLIPAKDLGEVRGNHFLRVETHFHGPYSYDACDDKGVGRGPEFAVNAKCLHDIKYALCANHVDVTFFTDHLGHMGEVDFSKLIVLEPSDQAVKNSAGVSIASQFNCENGFKAVAAPGLESPLLALGMEKHASEDLNTRLNIYGGGTPEVKHTLETVSHALVGVPHTESREIDYLLGLKPDFIEIYNVHANLHPRLRKDFLHVSPYAPFPHFIKYLVDIFHWLNADYLFMEFMEMNPVYFERWNALLAAGQHVTGVGGLDSHQNVLHYLGSDGERLDSHRRMTRFMSNLVLTQKDDLDSVKAAIKAGRVYFAVEGLGTPMGLDFHANSGSQKIEMGDTLHLRANQMTSLEFELPVVDPHFSGMDSGVKPEIYAELHFIDSKGKETTLVTSRAPRLSYPNPVPGNYRVHVWIIPHHLKKIIAVSSLADKPFVWVISNPIRVE